MPGHRGHSQICRRIGKPFHVDSFRERLTGYLGRWNNDAAIYIQFQSANGSP